MQRQVKLDTIPHAKCSCGKGPKGYNDDRGTGSFFLECFPCGVRSERADTLEGAAQRWDVGRHTPVPALPEGVSALPPPRKRSSRG